MAKDESTYIYVDGFNLYYGAVKKHPHLKWLDIGKLCRLLLQPHNIVSKIKYFTAPVKPVGDNDRPSRQKSYLRALETIPELEIIYGSFLSHEVNMPRADGTGSVKVTKTEEKGSDVNLAVHLVHDAHKGSFDTAVIISNDSDLVEAVRIVKDEIRKKVGILNPHARPSRTLQKRATFFKTIRTSALSHCLFPDRIVDSRGEFIKPPSWA